MCGRFTLLTPGQRIAELFGAEAPPGIVPRYNVAPTQTIIAVRAADDNTREIVPMRWGLIPSWTKLTEKKGAPLINARGETVATKPAFRAPFKRRRCLIPADGFFEWKAIGKQKQPYLIRQPGSKPFAFAGLWDRWIDEDRKALDSCAIITTEANSQMLALHDRMPVILKPVDYGTWIDAATTPEDLAALIRPLPEGALELSQVNTLVNSSRVDSPKCIEPAV